MYKGLKITALLKTPIIVRGFLTFDGLLGSILFDQLDDVDEAHKQIPIECSEEGLFSASAVQLTTLEKNQISIAANLRASHDLNPDHIKKSKDGTKLHTRLALKRRRDFGPVFNSYTMQTSPTADWFVVGDAEKIEELLAGSAHFIGKKRTAGFGQVKDWDISEVHTDGLTDEKGRPLRPIPVSQFQGNKKGLAVIDTAWRPAYWNPANRAACYAPEQSL